MDPQAAALRLQRLREARQRRAPDDALAPAFQRAAKDLRRLQRGLAGVAEAWEAICPPDLLGRTAIRSIRRGVLTIGVADATACYELDRLLKGGGERELIRRCPMGVRKVRLASDAIGETTR